MMKKQATVGRILQYSHWYEVLDLHLREDSCFSLVYDTVYPFSYHDYDNSISNQTFRTHLLDYKSCSLTQLSLFNDANSS